MAGTPYDSGQRLEPHPWVKRTDHGHITGNEFRRPSEPDDFGRVDFDDEEAASLFALFIERKPGESGYRLVVEHLADEVDLEIVHEA